MSISKAAPSLGASEEEQEGVLVRIAIAFTAWVERWFPDAFIFVAIAVVIVALAALVNGASPIAVTRAFGDGFWSLITFTMQMAFVAIGGYVVATSRPAALLIGRLAAQPSSGVGAVGLVAAVSLLASLLNWGLSLIFSGLLVLALSRRRELRMDYRAAGAAAYLGLGSVWALGLSSSAAQLQANPASLPKSLLPITGVIPFTETIFLWQSMCVAAIVIAVSIFIAVRSAPGPETALTAEKMGIAIPPDDKIEVAPPTQPGEWLEYSPALTILLVLLSAGWLIYEFADKNPMIAISNLNTYNFLFIMLGLLLHWQPKRFLISVLKAVPAISGVLIQFPFYGAIAAILTQPKNAAGRAVSDQIAHAFVSLTMQHIYPLAIGIYSAVLGFFMPSGGGKWLLEAPYLMQAANDLHVHLGWAVQVYNAAEALPNLINPFWMLPLLGVLGLRARNLVGFHLSTAAGHAASGVVPAVGVGIHAGISPPVNALEMRVMSLAKDSSVPGRMQTTMFEPGPKPRVPITKSRVMVLSATFAGRALRVTNGLEGYMTVRVMECFRNVDSNQWRCRHKTLLSKSRVKRLH